MDTTSPVCGRGFADTPGDSEFVNVACGIPNVIASKLKLMVDHYDVKNEPIVNEK